MRLLLREFGVDDEPENAAQTRILRRLQGKLVAYTTLDVSDENVLAQLEADIKDDPDAKEELINLGVHKRLRAAVMRGSDGAAELLVSLEGLDLGVTTIVDDKSRPRPLWVKFGTDLSILLRWMRPKERGKGDRPNYEVGFRLWSAALVLSKMVILQNHVSMHDFDNKDVLELGAGVGLCGLVVSKFCQPRRLVLSDFHQDIVANCAFNSRINGCEAICDAQPLDWSVVKETSMLDTYDTIIGADVVCQPDDCDMIADVLEKMLKPTGSAIFCLGSSESRFGVDRFEEVMVKRGFSVASSKIDGSDLQEWVSVETRSGSKPIEHFVGLAKSFVFLRIQKIG